MHLLHSTINFVKSFQIPDRTVFYTKETLFLNQVNLNNIYNQYQSKPGFHSPQLYKRQCFTISN